MISIPKSYNEVKLGHYLDFVKLQLADPTELATALAALIGTTYAEFANYPDYTAIHSGLAFANYPLTVTKAPPDLNFTHNFKGYIFLPHIMHLSLGQMIDFEAKKHTAGDNPVANIDLMLAAMLCINGVDGYKETRTLLTIESARQIVREMPTQQAYDIWLFFCNRSTSCLNGSDISMARQVQILISQAQRDWITNYGTDGATSWTTYAKAQFLNTMLFLVYLSETFADGVIGAWKGHILRRLRPHLNQKAIDSLSKYLSGIIPDKDAPDFTIEYNKFLILHI